MKSSAYNARQLSLCKRIRDHCQQQQWYGPDCDNPADFSSRYKEGYNLVTGEHFFEDRWDDIRLLRFAHPPVGDEQVAAAEEALGFALPKMLCALYTEVANGGFGPGYGMTGIQGGYTCQDDGRYQTVDQCTDTDASTRYFNLAEYEAQHGAPRHLLLPPNTWPSRFLHLEYWGCNTDSYLDGWSGHVYYTGLWEFVQTETGHVSIMNLYRQEESLEDWLETWLRHDWEAPELVPRRWFDFETVPTEFCVL